MGLHDTSGLDWQRRPDRAAGVAAALTLWLAGCLQAVSLALPLALPALGLERGQTLWWLQVLALACLVAWLDRSTTARQAALRGWLFAWAWLSSTFAWLYISMHDYGGLNALLAGLAVLTLAGVLALYYAGAAWLYQQITRVSKLPAAVLFAALWLLAELARGVLFTGFGWGAIGYAQLDGPLASLIPWLGEYGVGALAAALAVSVAQMGQLAVLRRARGRAALLALGLLVVLGLLWNLPTPQGSTSGHLSVSLLQGNIAQEEKFESASGVPQALRWYDEQLQASRSALVITPETAVPVLPQQLPDGYWQRLQQRFASGDQAALVGVPLGNSAQGYTNSVVGFKPDQAQDWRYDKHHLVPFGEFIPPLARWFVNLMSIPLGDFNRGLLPQPTFDWQGQRVAVTICYENLFTQELATQFTDATRAPTMLVNISNLGWFGEHLAMDQHLQIARMRALEFERPFLLATNTGHSGIVDHQGQVLLRAPSHVATVLSAQVQGRSAITPYAYWAARLGLWPLWGLALLVLLAAWGTRRRVWRA